MKAVSCAVSDNHLMLASKVEKWDQIRPIAPHQAKVKGSPNTVEKNADSTQIRVNGPTGIAAIAITISSGGD